MAPAPRIEGSRLVLRGWSESDRPAFGALNADPVVMEHFPSTMTLSESDQMLDRIVADWSRGYGLWAVDVQATSTFIGFIGLSSPSFTTDFTPCIEIGWRLAHASWGEGYATEGARLALRWGRAHLRFPRDEVVSFTTVANLRSRRVMEKLGLHHDPAGDFDHPLHALWAGRRHVLYRMALDADEGADASTPH